VKVKYFKGEIEKIESEINKWLEENNIEITNISITTEDKKTKQENYLAPYVVILTYK